MGAEPVCKETYTWALTVGPPPAMLLAFPQRRRCGAHTLPAYRNQAEKTEEAHGTEAGRLFVI